MKFLKIMMVGMAIAMSTVAVNAQGIGDILGSLGKNGSDSSSGSGVGDILGSVIEGVFTKTNLSLEDLVGEYQATGPAVTFKSENFLQKAGGIAGAATIESKLKPYYEQYGLNNMSLTVDEDANFTMKIKSLSLKGTIVKNDSEEGTFDFKFNVLGITLGKFTAYVEKSGKNLNLMFDATKLKSFISAVAKFTGNSMATALGNILDSYDGACIGWKMISTREDDNSGGSSALGTLKDILKGGK
ncbi:MAG: DUF4923 family protein [Muribaculaceae bacterium]|nr:DUF4923 family protein [Muribaculaceae bacterium]